MALKLNMNVNTVIFDFKNIGLIHKGQYYADIQFFIQTSKARYLIPPKSWEKIPWNASQVPDRSKNFNRNNIDFGTKNGIKSKKVSYKTKGWNIKYTEEEAILNEAVYCNTEIDLPASPTDLDISDLRIPLMMTVLLYFKR